MAITSYGENKNYKIIINKKELITSSQPFNRDGRIFVPMRDICEAIDAKVNDKVVTLDSPPNIRDGKTFVPVRFIAKNLYFDVYWQSESNSVILNSFIFDCFRD